MQNGSVCVWVLVDEEMYDCMTNCGEPRAKQWLFEMEEQLDEASYVQMIVTVWALWKAKRDVLHENKFQSPFETCHFVTQFLHEI